MSADPAVAVGRVGAQRRLETPDAAALAALAGEHLDLVRAPFTLPRSRLLVFREGDGVRVHTSEYERSLAECRVLDTLVVRDATGAAPADHAGAAARDRTRRRGRDARLRRARPRSPSARRRIEPDATSRSSGRHPTARAPRVGARRPDHRRCGSTSAPTAVSARGIRRPSRRPRGERVDLARLVRALSARARRPAVDDRVLLVGARRQHRRAAGARSRACGRALEDRVRRALAVGRLLHRGRTPPRRPRARARTARTRLPVPERRRTAARRRARARGARDQRRPPAGRSREPASGRLRDRRPVRRPFRSRSRRSPPGRSRRCSRSSPPTTGRASSSRRSAARRTGGSRHPTSTVTACPSTGIRTRRGSTTTRSSTARCRRPAPDLGAYLVLQDLELARFAERFGDADAAAHRSRAERTLGLLLDLWDDERGLFARAGRRCRGRERHGRRADAAAHRAAARADRRPARGRARTITRRFGAATGRCRRSRVGDPDFSPERMWRGPVWVNTNALVVDGTARVGASGSSPASSPSDGGARRCTAADRTSTSTRSRGRRRATATTAFGWSAALFIDLAVGALVADRVARGAAVLDVRGRSSTRFPWRVLYTKYRSRQGSHMRLRTLLLPVAAIALLSGCTMGAGAAAPVALDPDAEAVGRDHRVVVGCRRDGARAPRRRLRGGPSRHDRERGRRRLRQCLRQDVGRLPGRQRAARRRHDRDRPRPRVPQ